MTDTDVLLMDGMARTLLPMETDVTSEPDVCPICLANFHGRDVAPVDVKTQCLTQCGHRFHLDCISKQFIFEPIGSRRCAMCRECPMPVVNQKTSESHPDTFFPDQVFYDACYDGDLIQVERSLAAGVCVNAVMTDDFTALIVASSEGHIDVVERLIKDGADVNVARATDGATSLFYAAQENNTDIGKLLIDSGANLNTPRTSDGATPLFFAAQENNSDFVTLMIEAGADLNAARTSDGTTPLSIATKMGNSDCVELLTNAGAR